MRSARHRVQVLGERVATVTAMSAPAVTTAARTPQAILMARRFDIANGSASLQVESQILQLPAELHVSVQAENCAAIEKQGSRQRRTASGPIGRIASLRHCEAAATKPLAGSK